MDNYNNIINNDYNSMVYGNNMQQQHPMTSIPREMQIAQNAPMHQHPVSNQQSDIINLSYNRDMQMPHPDLPQQMGLYPTIPQQNQEHNHVMQSQQQQPQSIEQSEVQQQIPANISMQYSMENVDVNTDINMQNENTNFENEGDGESSNIENAGDENIPAQSGDTPLDAIKEEDTGTNDENSSEGKQMEDGVEVKKEPDVDPNQCRVCKSTETLIDIFAIEEDMRICDIIMKMCSNIRIHERDYLPHMICLSCLGRLRTAYQLMRDVVSTDAELRAKLTRHKRARKPNEGVIIIDCNEFTDSDNYEQNDDDDYQISNAEEEEDDFETGEDSDSEKRIKIPKKRGPKPKNKQKKFKQELATTAKRLKRDIVFIEADDSSEERRKKEKCKECGKIFSNKIALRMHRQKAHISRRPTEEEAPFKCNVCSRAFKYSINLTSHMQLHKDSYACDECGRVFALKSDAKKHALNSHKCSLSYECNKCRRLYTSVKRYQKHRESCSDYSSSSSKRDRKMMKMKEEIPFTGRDLFKSVAPATTTYWSDSFSD